MNIDQTLLLFIQDYLRSDLLSGLLCTITVLGNKGAIWLAFLLMLLIYPRTRKLGLLAGLSLLVCVSLGEALKYTVMRPRPFLEIAELVPLVKPPDSYSFPSVHTVSSFSVAWIILWSHLSGKVRYAVFAFALLMSFSRLYVGVHYPSDVLAGILLALAGSYGVWRWKGHLLKQSVLGSSSCKERGERL